MNNEELRDFALGRRFWGEPTTSSYGFRPQITPEEYDRAVKFIQENGLVENDINIIGIHKALTMRVEP